MASIYTLEVVRNRYYSVVNSVIIFFNYTHCVQKTPIDSFFYIIDIEKNVPEK